MLWRLKPPLLLQEKPYRFFVERKFIDFLSQYILPVCFSNPARGSNMDITSLVIFLTITG
jgi:hypothetical protein